MTMEKPSKGEDEYFARQDAELIRKERDSTATQADDDARHSHVGKCPRCGHDMHHEGYHEIPVQRCGNCGGVFLDSAALEQLATHHDPGILGRVFADLSKALQGPGRHT
ncbi:MAG: zf-TFIIB domain-containing protein [Gemmatimonadales bacterium]